MTNAEAGRRTEPTVELVYSWVPTLAASVVLALAGGWLVYLGYAGLAIGHALGWVVTAGALAFSPLVLMFVGPVLHAWRHLGPVVTLDERGVTDIRKAHPFIPWSDIGQIDLGYGESASYLCFEFRRPDRQREDPPVAFFLGNVFKRLQALSDWNISLRLLACRKAEVLQQARRLHQQALRQQVVRMNRSSNANPDTKGWSGSL